MAQRIKVTGYIDISDVPSDDQDLSDSTGLTEETFMRLHEALQYVGGYSIDDIDITLQKDS